MVKAWKEKVIIPTYEVGKPEKNPIFLEKRVYQGSSGVVYPYPVIESISNKKTDKEYNAVYLENDYIKVMILPELGGRVQMAYDKIKKRHFIYYNQVIISIVLILFKHKFLFEIKKKPVAPDYRPAYKAMFSPDMLNKKVFNRRLHCEEALHQTKKSLLGS